jgi:NADH-quinone oxidoreductase subunit M
MVILAAFPKGFWIALLAGTSLVLGAAYNLWMYKRVIFGAVANAKVAALQDLKTEEFVVLGLLAVAVLGMGIWPNPLVDVTHASVDALLAHLQRGKLGL